MDQSTIITVIYSNETHKIAIPLGARVIESNELSDLLLAPYKNTDDLKVSGLKDTTTNVVYPLSLITRNATCLTSSSFELLTKRQTKRQETRRKKKKIRE